VLLIEVRCRHGGDEELTAVGAGLARIGHRHRARHVVFQVWHELVLEISAPDTRATRAITQGISGLDHESTNHAVEDDAVVITIFGMHGEVLQRLAPYKYTASYPEAQLRTYLDGLGRVVGKQFDVNVALCRVQHCSPRQFVRTLFVRGNRGLFVLVRPFIEHVT
jgi:hypothetical protein